MRTVRLVRRSHDHERARQDALLLESAENGPYGDVLAVGRGDEQDSRVRKDNYQDSLTGQGG